jgi:hypothetical protein
MEPGFQPRDGRLARAHTTRKLPLRHTAPSTVQNHEVGDRHALLVLLLERGILGIDPASGRHGSDAVS